MTLHPLQTPAWAEFRKAMGIDVIQTNGWQLTFHKIPYTPWTIGYFPKGPMPSAVMLATLATLARKKRAIFIQLEPNVSHVPRLSSLVPSHHPLFTKYTFILDLTKPDDELLTAMHPKTRYNIRIAKKYGVTIQEDNTAFDDYLRLTKETTIRQKFYAHSVKYHKNMWTIMHKAGIAHLFTATYKKEILCAWIVFVVDKTIYYPYGASSRLHREVMAPTLMLWEITKWAKQKGLKYFDLWGAMGPNPNPKDPWFGFHRFKQGFSPRLVEFAGSFDLVINKPLYTLYTIADTIRWRILHGISAISHLR